MREKCQVQRTARLEQRGGWNEVRGDEVRGVRILAFPPNEMLKGVSRFKLVTVHPSLQVGVCG